MQTVTYAKYAGALLGALLAVAVRAEEAYTGLWVGNVVVQQINRPGPATAAWDTTNYLAAANAFNFRVILHVDTNGQARLLQRVLLAYSATGATAVNPITGQVTTNGTYRLLSDESYAAAIRQTNAQATITRISSVNFPLMAPVLLDGQFGPGTNLMGEVVIAYDDPVNPFVHVYAPLHDNLQIRNAETTKLADGDESYTIRRYVTFQFDGLMPTGTSGSAAGYAGDFHETIEGLYRPVQVQGRFQVQRLTTIGQLE